MFSRELVYVLSAIILNNILIAVIIVVNMRRIVEYIREQIVKVQLDHCTLFKYADIHFGFYKDALDIIDDDIHIPMHRRGEGFLHFYCCIVYSGNSNVRGWLRIGQCVNIAHNKPEYVAQHKHC